MSALLIWVISHLVPNDVQVVDGYLRDLVVLRQDWQLSRA